MPFGAWLSLPLICPVPRVAKHGEVTVYLVRRGRLALPPHRTPVGVSQLVPLHHVDLDLGFGCIVASEIEAPNMFANLV